MIDHVDLRRIFGSVETWEVSLQMRPSSAMRLFVRLAEAQETIRVSVTSKISSCV